MSLGTNGRLSVEAPRLRLLAVEKASPFSDCEDTCTKHLPVEHPHQYTHGMTLDNLLSQIDAEISRLQNARRLLSGANSSIPSKVTSKPRQKRRLSAEARKRIADAQRKRWAKQKKAAKAAS